MQEFELKDIADELLIIPKLTIDCLFQLDNSADCIALYMLYYKTAKWQKTNQPKATDEYVKKCLKWGYERIRNTKQTLKEHGLIDIVQQREDGKISGWYVRVSYIVTQKNMEDIKIQVQDDDNKLSSQEVGFSTGSEQKTSTLINNNKYLNKKDKVLKNKNIYSQEAEICKLVIDYLNKIANTNFRYSTNETMRCIKARLKEGYELKDFYKVIDNKWEDWKNTEWQQYMRPSTLFGNKFENYLNAKIFKGTPSTSYSNRPNTADNTATHTTGNPKISDLNFRLMTFEARKDYISNMALADMTKDQKEFFEKYCLARDENGNLLKF